MTTIQEVEVALEDQKASIRRGRESIDYELRELDRKIAELKKVEPCPLEEGKDVHCTSNEEACELMKNMGGYLSVKNNYISFRFGYGKRSDALERARRILEAAGGTD